MSPEILPGEDLGQLAQLASEMLPGSQPAAAELAAPARARGAPRLVEMAWDWSDCVGKTPLQKRRRMLTDLLLPAAAMLVDGDDDDEMKDDDDKFRGLW